MAELICITCPKGCHLSVDDNMNVTGNGCVRGKEYAINELTNPVRMITSTVICENGSLPRVSVKTSKAISKKLVFDVMHELEGVVVQAPVNIGDIIIENVLDSGVNIIATKNIERV